MHVIQGTLKADGTLVLDSKPELPPGRVEVVIQPISALPGDHPLSAVMQQIWQEQDASGFVPPTREEIDAQVREFREESDERIHEAAQAHRLADGVKPENIPEERPA